jgi:hypothetical protein
VEKSPTGRPLEDGHAAPTLSDAALQAAADLAQLTSFDYAALSLLLCGLVPDSILDGLEIPQAPARAARRTPEEIAADWLLGNLAVPLPATVATEPTPDMSPGSNPSHGFEPPVPGPECHSG